MGLKKDIMQDILLFNLFPLTEGYRIQDFECEIGEYSNFLQNLALEYQRTSITSTHLLINKRNADVVAYMSLVADSIKLNEGEKQEHELEVPLPAFPALKIAKLAVNVNYKETYYGIGTLMIMLARGFVEQMKQCGVACKFITIDADVENNPSVIEFYGKNGFKTNEKYIKKKSRQISMRLSVDENVHIEQYDQTGTE